jgi:2'-5' RNA ligase
VNPVSWKVTEFVLVHSLVGQTRYIQLARWTLEG